MARAVSESGWFEAYEGGTRPIPLGWRKEWFVENVYGWTWYGPRFRTVSLIVLDHEPTLEERREIEERFKDAKEPL